MTRRLGVGLVTAAALCWSSGGLIARLAGTDAWTTIFWRSVFCAAFLSSAVLLTQRGRLSEIVRQAGWPGFGMAACFAIASTAFIMALSRTSVANTLIIQSLALHRGSPGLALSRRAREAANGVRHGRRARGHGGDAGRLAGWRLADRRRARPRHGHLLRGRHRTREVAPRRLHARRRCARRPPRRGSGHAGVSPRDGSRPPRPLRHRAARCGHALLHRGRAPHPRGGGLPHPGARRR